MQVSTLRPGLLVSLKTSVTGNVHYDKREIEAEHLTDSGVQMARWETTRMVTDPAEQERAKVARGKCRSIITAVCANSAFGLLCPESRADDLEEAIAESRRIAEGFNSGAMQTKIAVYIISGRVAQDDREAIRAINSEVRDLLAAMATGIEKLDAATVREAANKARNIGSMLAADAQQRLQDAIDAVRAEARKMVKAGEQVAIEIDSHTLAALAVARTQFLDLEGDDKVSAPVAEARAADLEPGFTATIDEAEEFGDLLPPREVQPALDLD